MQITAVIQHICLFWKFSLFERYSIPFFESNRHVWSSVSWTLNQGYKSSIQTILFRCWRNQAGGKQVEVVQWRRYSMHAPYSWRPGVPEGLLDRGSSRMARNISVLRFFEISLPPWTVSSLFVGCSSLERVSASPRLCRSAPCAQTEEWLEVVLTIWLVVPWVPSLVVRWAFCSTLLTPAVQPSISLVFCDFGIHSLGFVSEISTSFNIPEEYHFYVATGGLLLVFIISFFLSLQAPKGLFNACTSLWLELVSMERSTVFCGCFSFWPSGFLLAACGSDSQWYVSLLAATRLDPRTWRNVHWYELWDLQEQLLAKV